MSNGDDVRVIQGRSGLRLLHETAFTFRIGKFVGGENLDCYDAVEAGIARLPYFAHAARADRRDDFIRAEFVACGKWHVEMHPIYSDQKHAANELRHPETIRPEV